jgi:hypothetical protein
VAVGETITKLLVEIIPTKSRLVLVRVGPRINGSRSSEQEIDRTLMDAIWRVLIRRLMFLLGRLECSEISVQAGDSDN